MKSSVTISLIPEARGGPFVFWDDLPKACKQASELGFDGIEIFAPDPGVINPQEVEKLLNDNQLSVAAMGTGGGWIRKRLTLTHSDAQIREQAENFIRSMIDLAAEFGAPAIIGSMQGRWGDTVSREQALDYLRQSLNRLGDHAATLGVPLLYEPVNRYETNVLTNIADGVAFIESLTSKNVRLLADLFHMNIEEVNPGEAIRSTGKYLGHVHFVDTNRRPAGMGHMDYLPIRRALAEIGYTKYLSAEALPYPDPYSAAKQTIETYKKYFS
jgi:sugar phosphate isomerase/epimerase